MVSKCANLMFYINADTLIQNKKQRNKYFITNFQNYSAILINKNIAPSIYRLTNS